jgi:hypothetical protein
MLAPHPSRPGSMVAFVALPAFLVLLTLVSVPARLFPVRLYVPIGFDTSRKGDHPEGQSERVMKLVKGLDTGTVEERGRKLQALVRETARCPAYAPYTVRRLVSGLCDPDPKIRAGTAFALGALGAHASEALPFLRAARGKRDAHLDHVLSEAIWWIEHGETLPGEERCEPLPITGLD